jgi:heme/copper-type cytochrome/quinol oxidase subunit 2
MASALFWLAVASCVVGQVALLLSAIRAPMVPPPDSASMRMPSRSSEIAWTIVPAIGLVVLLAFTWRATHRPVAPDPHAGHEVINE